MLSETKMKQCMKSQFDKVRNLRCIHNFSHLYRHVDRQVHGQIYG